MPREIDLFFFRTGETPMWEVRLKQRVTCLEFSIRRNLDCKSEKE
jgi:hypothetical protein